MQTKRLGLIVGVMDNILYAIGGTNSTSVQLSSVEAYDPSTDVWVTIRNTNVSKRHGGKEL